MPIICLVGEVDSRLGYGKLQGLPVSLGSLIL